MAAPNEVPRARLARASERLASAYAAWMEAEREFLKASEEYGEAVHAAAASPYEPREASSTMLRSFGDVGPDTLSLPEVAKRLGVSHATVSRAAKQTGIDGEIAPGVSEVVPGVKVLQLGPGGRYRVSRYQLDEFLRTGKVSS